MTPQSRSSTESAVASRSAPLLHPAMSSSSCLPLESKTAEEAETATELDFEFGNTNYKSQASQEKEHPDCGSGAAKAKQRIGSKLQFLGFVPQIVVDSPSVATRLAIVARPTRGLVLRSFDVKFL